MPAGVDWCDYFDVDKLGVMNIDISPRYPEVTLEETDRYAIRTSPWGVTMKHFKEEDSTPEFLDYKITTPETWEEAKKRMTLTDDRIPWDSLRQNYGKWRAEGRWIRGVFWFGFDVAHSWMMGTENMLVAMIEEPEFVQDIFDTYLSHTIALFDRIWDAGYHFDEMFWYDDMGYKGTTFFSPRMYRELLQPYHTRAVKWAHDHGTYAQLHSCGDVMTLLPDIVATGVDALNPLEVKAGMDVFDIKRRYGDRLTLHGGIIFSSDHSIPNSVSLDNMKRIVAEVNWQAAAARGAPPGKPAIALCRREGSPAARDGGVHRLGLQPAGLLHTSAARRGQLRRAARPRGLPLGIRKVRPSGRGR